MLKVIPRSLRLLTALALFVLGLPLIANTLNVGADKTYPTIQSAIIQTQPGDTVLIHPGTYTTSTYIVEKSGTFGVDIVIRGVAQTSVIIEGPSSSMQFVDCSNITVENLTMRGQKGNALMFDDGGTYDSPSRFISVRDIVFEDMEGASNVNTNFLKMAGVDDFSIEHCRFTNGPVNSLGIDLVGCHDGQILSCDIRGTSSGGIQMKGGSFNITVFGNTFAGCGDRSINIGGNTGLPYFRPLNATFEASEIRVYSNSFFEGRSAISFAGAVRSEVVNNTIVDPISWPFRILQESVDTGRFEPCGSNVIVNNIIFYRDGLNAHFNIGPNTAPETFSVSNNLWYNSDVPSKSNPDISPIVETESVYGLDPLLTHIAYDHSVQAGSPAIGKGSSQHAPEFDLTNKRFASPPSIGAYEGATTTNVFENGTTEHRSIIRTTTGFIVRLPNDSQRRSCALYDLRGRLLRRIELDGGDHHVPAGSQEFLVVE